MLRLKVDAPCYRAEEGVLFAMSENHLSYQMKILRIHEKE